MVVSSRTRTEAHLVSLLSNPSLALQASSIFAVMGVLEVRFWDNHLKDDVSNSKSMGYILSLSKRANEVSA